MRILIINNGTKHIKELQLRCTHISGVPPSVIAWNDFSRVDLLQYDKIILSGSSQYSVPRGNHFEEQKRLILESKIPILGICAGFQLICIAYGNFVLKYPYLISGYISIRKTNTAEIIPVDRHSFAAYEHHRFFCPAVRDPLIPLAVSGTGVEMVKHQQKPHFGCQFHPEVNTESNEAGFVLEHFIQGIY